MSKYHSCKDCISYGSCENAKAGQKDYMCNQWDWRYAGSWFDK